MAGPSRGLFLCLGILATRERVHKLFEAQLVCNLILLQLLSDVLLNALFVFTYRIHEIPSCPEMPISVLVLQIRMSVENHQATFPFQIPHHIRDAILGRKTYQHVDVVGTRLCFDNLNPFLFTQLPEYLSYILFNLAVHYHSAVLWRKHHMILTSPRCVT